MDLIVPESISSTASQGEQILYKIFRDKLPDNFLVYYKQNTLNSCVDFIIIAPNLGLLLIDVISWYSSQIISVNDDNVSVVPHPKSNRVIDIPKSSLDLNIHGRRTRKRSLQPKDEKEVYQWNINKYQELLAQLSSKLQKYQHFNQFDSDNQIKLAFPIGYGIVFSNMTQEQCQENGIDKILTKSQLIYRKELLDLQSASSSELVKKLQEIFVNKFSFSTITPEQINTIKTILFPEISIQAISDYTTSISNALQQPNQSILFKTLDHHQESIVRTIGAGHRIIYGVAGSGKTLILLCHAKLLIRQNPNRKILILCFNRSLAAYLKSILYEDIEYQNLYRRIELFTFYAWVSSIVRKVPGQSGFSPEYYDGVLGEILLAKLDKLTISHKYDAILVDEAQTFHSSWFKCCVAALKDPENGNLMIVADGRQSIYKRENFTWKSVGIKAVGRTSNKKFRLDKNYRNTHEILAAAWGLFNHEKNIDEIDNNIDLSFEIIKPTDASRNGSVPILHIEASEQQEIESVSNEIRELKKAGYLDNEIAIIYRIGDEKRLLLIDNLIKKINALGLNTYWVSKSRISEKEYSNQQYGIRIINALSSLGLEFKVVLIIGVQDWEFNISPFSESDILTCKRLYVAMTRAQDILHVFGSGNSRLIKQLQSSGHFIVKQG